MQANRRYRLRPSGTKALYWSSAYSPMRVKRSPDTLSGHYFSYSSAMSITSTIIRAMTATFDTTSRVLGCSDSSASSLFVFSSVAMILATSFGSPRVKRSPFLVATNRTIRRVIKDVRSVRRAKGVCASVEWPHGMARRNEYYNKAKTAGLFICISSIATKQNLHSRPSVRLVFRFGQDCRFISSAPAGVIRQCRTIR